MDLKTLEDENQVHVCGRLAPEHTATHCNTLQHTNESAPEHTFDLVLIFENFVYVPFMVDILLMRPCVGAQEMAP